MAMYYYLQIGEENPLKIREEIKNNVLNNDHTSLTEDDIQQCLELTILIGKQEVFMNRDILSMELDRENKLYNRITTKGIAREWHDSMVEYNHMMLESAWKKFIRGEHGFVYFVDLYKTFKGVTGRELYIRQGNKLGTYGFGEVGIDRIKETEKVVYDEHYYHFYRWDSFYELDEMLSEMSIQRHENKQVAVLTDEISKGLTVYSYLVKGLERGLTV